MRIARFARSGEIAYGLVQGTGQDPDIELAADHLTPEAVVGTPEWDLDRAAAAMLSGNFRHLVICADDDVVGVLSVRDIVKAWSTREGARE